MKFVKCLFNYFKRLNVFLSASWEKFEILEETFHFVQTDENFIVGRSKKLCKINFDSLEAWNVRPVLMATLCSLMSFKFALKLETSNFHRERSFIPPSILSTRLRAIKYRKMQIQFSICSLIAHSSRIIRMFTLCLEGSERVRWANIGVVVFSLVLTSCCLSVVSSKLRAAYEWLCLLIGFFNCTTEQRRGRVESIEWF